MSGPFIAEYGEPIYFGKRSLFPRRFFTFAGGSQNLEECQFSFLATGYISNYPDFKFRLLDMECYDLKISARSNCDTVLLVKDAIGRWHYDDDGGPGLDPMVYLDDGGSVIDVWVGAHKNADDYCFALLALETFFRFY